MITASRIESAQGLIVDRVSPPPHAAPVPHLQAKPFREDPQYQTFDHLIKEFHAQQEVESAVRVRTAVVFRSTTIQSVKLPSATFARVEYSVAYYGIA